MDHEDIGYGLRYVADHNARMDEFDFSLVRGQNSGHWIEGDHDNQGDTWDITPNDHQDGEALAVPNDVRTLRSLRTRQTLSRDRSPAASSGVSSGRVTKSTTTRQARRRKGRNNNTSLAGPLSELTKDSKTPIRDIDTFINRPLEERRQEAEGKKNGKTPRPMNSFMLYRSAYAERIKEWGSQNNHQVVSSVAGASWAMEPQEVKAKFEEWAEVEKERHKAAFPEYKYTPGKSKLVQEEEDHVDAEDPDAGLSDAEYFPNRRVAARSRKPLPAHSLHDSSPHLSSAYATPEDHASDQSPWTLQQAPRPLPSSYGMPTQANPYYTTQPHFPGYANPYQLTHTFHTAPFQQNFDPQHTNYTLQSGLMTTHRDPINFQTRDPMSLITHFEWPRDDNVPRRLSTGGLQSNHHTGISPTPLQFFDTASMGGQAQDYSTLSIDPNLINPSDLDAAFSKDMSRDEI